MFTSLLILSCPLLPCLALPCPQELVFIGVGMKKEELWAALDGCLCTEAEVRCRG